ncbi:MAG: hypothetical protein LBI79_09135 [Nitrososphaerota archaeon]|jgi:hypothetical protein|nr:hypothetical protein [Nitrososphaerota archaeon]
MLISSTKRFILPFWNQRSKESQEAAAVFAVAELNRSRGGGFLAKQPPEILTFIAKIAYPLWLFPKNGAVLIFDGLNDKDHTITYVATPPSDVFLANLERSQRPRENYLTFLADHASYFGHPPKERQFTLKGLIDDADFRKEFSIYRQEATELTGPATTLLLATLEESTVLAAMNELDKLQFSLKAEEEKLSECLRLVKKTTSQYITEIGYEAEAAAEEADAKIKAQEELDKPQITKLNKEYSRKIKALTEGFDGELDSLLKLRLKTQTLIEKTQANIEQYKHEANVHAKKGHEIYEKRWKQKIKKTEKELSGLKKELKNIDDKTKKTTKQKEQGVSRLNFEWDAEIKLVHQPLDALEEAKNAKTLTFKQESNRLLQIETPVVEGIEKLLKHKEAINTAFDGLGFNDPQLKTPRLVYVPFYAICYEAGLDRRYSYLAPSTLRETDFGSKLKGALGMSKTKDLLTPRFKAIATLINQVEGYTQKNSIFEARLMDLAEKNNLLKNNAFQTNIKNGLVILQSDDWLSQRETEELTRQLKT